MKENFRGGWDFIFSLHASFPCVKDYKESMEKKSSDALVTVFLGHKVFKQKTHYLGQNQIFVLLLLLTAYASVVTCIFLREKDLFFYPQ